MKAQVNYYVILTITYNFRDEKDGQYLPMDKPESLDKFGFYPTDAEVAYWDEHWMDRKYCGEIPAKNLPYFLQEIGAATTCQTMGALTLEYGHLPAISFESEGYGYEQRINAYVSPVLPSEELYKAFEALPEGQQEVVRERVANELEKSLEYLEKDILNLGWLTEDEDPEMPEFMSEIEVDLYQLRLAL